MIVTIRIHLLPCSGDQIEEEFTLDSSVDYPVEAADDALADLWWSEGLDAYATYFQHACS